MDLGGAIFIVEMKVLRFDDLPRERWRNGAGETAVVAAGPDASAPRWRVSVATLEQSGPFSRFAGIDRTLVPMGGTRLTLVVDRARHDVAPGEPFAFSGEAEVTAEVHQPGRVLNLMTADETSPGKVDVRSAAAGLSVGGTASMIALVAVVDGQVVVRSPGEDVLLTVGDAAVLDGPVSVEGPGVVAIVQVGRPG